MNRLPPNHWSYAGRVIVHLRMWGIMWRDIASVWGCRLTTLENAMVRARGGWRACDG